jgi:hypothetical protein
LTKHSTECPHTRKIVSDGVYAVEAIGCHQPKRELNQELTINLLQVKNVEHTGEFNEGTLLSVQGALRGLSPMRGLEEEGLLAEIFQGQFWIKKRTYADQQRLH